MAPADLAVKLQWDNWADTDVDLPGYETDGAAGADIRANFPAGERAQGATLAPMQRLLVPTGLRMEVAPGYEVQVRPRSGLALKHGVSLLNTPGTIDSDYRGPVGIMLINLGADRFRVSHGDRIAQLIVAPVAQARFLVADDLSDTVRGEGGFGSTGLR